MSARARFRLYDRVKLSATGLHHFRPELGYRAINANTRGTVVGYGRSSESVIIVRDGIKTREGYWHIYWDVDDTPFHLKNYNPRSNT